MSNEATLKVPSLHCSSCASTVKRHVQVLPGVEAIDVDTSSKLVRVTYNESEVSLDRIRETLDEIGFYAED